MCLPKRYVSRALRKNVRFAEGEKASGIVKKVRIVDVS